MFGGSISVLAHLVLNHSRGTDPARDHLCEKFTGSYLVAVTSMSLYMVLENLAWFIL